MQVLTIKNSDIAKHLSLPPVKLHCSMLAEDAIKAAVRDIKARCSPIAVPPSLPTATLMSWACQELRLCAAILCCNRNILLQGPGAQKKTSHYADASTAVVQAKRNAAVTPPVGTEAFAGAAAS